jgi:hypothetical protein
LKPIFHFWFVFVSSLQHFTYSYNFDSE